MKYPVTPVAILIICCLFIAGASAIPVIVGFKEMPRAGAISPGGTLMTASGHENKCKNINLYIAKSDSANVTLSRTHTRTTAYAARNTHFHKI